MWIVVGDKLTIAVDTDIVLFLFVLAVFTARQGNSEDTSELTRICEYGYFYIRDIA